MRKMNQNVFFLLLKRFNAVTATKRKQTILSYNRTILTKLYVGNVYNRS